MNANYAVQIEFIKDLLRKGDKRKDILDKFAKKWQNSSTTTFDRRLKAAIMQYKEELKLLKSKTDDNIGKEAEARKNKIMGVLERQEFLCLVIKGEIVFPTKKVIWHNPSNDYKTITVNDLPNGQERLKALAELNKMCGDYAAAKQDITITNSVSDTDMTSLKIRSK